MPPFLVSIVVRTPTVDDADRLADINIAAWRSAYAGIVPETYLRAMAPPTYRKRWLRYIAQPTPGVTTSVAEVDGVLASYCVVGPYRTQEDAAADEDTTGWGEVFAVYTDPGFQGHGAGTSLHDAGLACLAGYGCTQAALWVLQANHRSIAWYGERGWRPDGATSLWSGAGEPLVEVRLRHRMGLSDPLV